jgi:hypothetical protein
VPEAGQSEQTQRAKVGDLWDTRDLWTMSTEVEYNGCPNQERHWVAFAKRNKVIKGDDKNLCKCWK